MLIYTQMFTCVCRGHHVNLSVRQYAKSFKDTLNLPRTSFPLSMKDGVVRLRETAVQKTAAFKDLYKWQKNQGREKKFVLHDGPPYANGEPHVGHALNKILKDITNRYKLLRGYEVSYVPGWDCHGLPIEHRALAAIRADHTTMEPIDIRHKAQKFARKALKTQKAAFMSWGVMGDWTRPYLTLDPHYEATQLEVFYDLYQKGYVYQQYMPVHWSPSSRTALAESELEYHNDHQSTALYVKFPLCRLPDRLWRRLSSEVQPFVLIWTTTAWTLPANQAICYGTGIEYCFAKSKNNRSAFLIGRAFVEKLSEILGTRLDMICTFQGRDLEGTTYTHPAMDNRKQHLLAGRHVTVERGTGLVHTAPAHGADDFQVAVNHHLPLSCVVDEAGHFTELAGPQLHGKAVLGDGNQSVISLMEEQVVHREEYTHSYPYDWRTKQPVILRSSLQWFINTQALRDRALDELSRVSVIPAGQDMVRHLEARSYWCISRQRSWGVPIPVFYHTETRQPLLTGAVMNHMTRLVRAGGSDVWWTLPINKLLPDHVLQDSGVTPSESYERGRDVLDIWFDSGVSWASVLKGEVADVYMEGLDQFGGWFLSSLITSVAARNEAPYRSLVVHGFTVDEDGKKMSKSLGNVVDPQHVIHGKKGSHPGYGVDVLRLWCAQAGFDKTINIGPSVLERCHQQVFKLRKMLRFLMGNLADFNRDTDQTELSCMLPQDQYTLHLLHRLSTQVKVSYDHYNFAAALRLIEKFTSGYLSPFYCSVTKNRMYCAAGDDPVRRACQTVQLQVLEALTCFMAPILPHLAEEAAQHPPFIQYQESVFHSLWYDPDPSWCQPHLDDLFVTVTSLRDTFFGTIAADNPSQFHVIVCARPQVFSQLKQLQAPLTASDSALCELLQCSLVTLLCRPPLVILDEAQVVDARCPTHGGGEEAYTLVIMPSEGFSCPRCRRHVTNRINQLCCSCEQVLAGGWES